VDSPFSGLGKFDVVLADPPWSYYGQQDKWAAAAKFYDLMSDEHLLELPVGDILTDKGVLFMWATAPRIDFAIDLLRAWGLTFRGIAFVWVKTKQDCLTPIGAQGVRPSIVKPTSELVLAASRVKRGRPMPIADEAVRQIVLAPKQEHSRKPDDIHESIDRLYPNASKIELFARRKYPGWEAWGNEC
jgi:N6-adenosine-specific RNA methylase IME4